MNDVSVYSAIDQETKLILLDDALAIIERLKVDPISVEERQLQDALRFRVALDVCSQRALPAFDSSAVDGYAFRLEKTFDPNRPLKIVGDAFAGEPFDQALLEGSAVHIATGAVMPPDADTIVMQEHCTVADRYLTLKNTPKKGAYVRQKGADVKVGDLLLRRGQALLPQDIALLLGIGFETVAVQRTLKVAVISTGKELSFSKDLSRTGDIIDTNSLMLRDMMQHLPVEVTGLKPLPDNRDATLLALKTAANFYDLIITTGGISVGRKDYVGGAIAELGRVHFWKLAIRPGRPAMLGQIGAAFIAALPGNPVSAMVTFFLLVRPLLNRLWGGKVSLPPAYRIPLLTPIQKDNRLRSFPRVRLELTQSGWAARLFEDQTSNLLRSLTESQGLLDLAETETDFALGDHVLFRPFSGLLD